MLVSAANVQLRVNQKGGIYDNGRAHSNLMCERVLNLHHEGLSDRAIAREMKTSRSFVNKVVRNYNENSTALRLSRTGEPWNKKVTTNILEYIEVHKNIKPSMLTSEIQRLLLDGVLLPDEIPLVTAINTLMREKLLFTKKKISQVPSESSTPQNMDAINEYLNDVSNVNGFDIAFSDEASMIKTTGNRSYGNSTIGERAVEVQCYASNANFTINLLSSARAISYWNILEGPSNGMELLNFFEKALNVEFPDGSAVLENGSVVVMDNCGFHHAHLCEPIL